MKLIVGLGNPGREFQDTRHNAGFWVVDAVATRYGADWSAGRKMFCDIAQVKRSDVAFILAKPDTYMNLSGKAVQAILSFYKEITELLVVHDDVSLPLGKIRYQRGGGAGGQHGIEDIMQMLGGRMVFDRLKFGVGPDPGGERRAGYVLSAIPQSESDLRDKVIGLCVDSISIWLKNGISTASNKFNGIDLRPAPPPPPPPPEVVPEKNLD